MAVIDIVILNNFVPINDFPAEEGQPGYLTVAQWDSREIYALLNMVVH